MIDRKKAKAQFIQELAEPRKQVKRVEEKLHATDELLDKIFTTSHFLIACMDRDFNFLSVNRAYAEADGRKPEFFTGKNHFDLYPDKENEAVSRRVVETGEPYTALARPFEYREHPERGVTYWDWSLRALKGASGRVEGLVLCLVNVTKRIRTEEELKKHRRRLEEMVEKRTIKLKQANKKLQQEIAERKEAEKEFDQFFSFIPDLLCVAGFDGYFKRLNPAWEKTLGYTVEELHSKPFLDFVHPADRAATAAELERLAGGRKTSYFENRYRYKDGSYKWLAWTGSPLVEKGLTYAVARDISEPCGKAKRNTTILLTVCRKASGLSTGMTAPPL